MIFLCTKTQAQNKAELCFIVTMICYILSYTNISSKNLIIILKLWSL